MDRRRLAARLAEAFDAPPGAARAVARAAGDLADDGALETDLGVGPTVEVVVEHLSDAPADHGLVERWNWWMGSLDLAYGGYDRFIVRRWREPGGGGP